MQTTSYPKSLLILSSMFLVLAPSSFGAQETPTGSVGRGKAFFEINCAVCHSSALGPDNLVLNKQGPSLVGVVGRPAGSQPYFNYTKAIRDTGITWDAGKLYHFLENPMEVV